MVKRTTNRAFTLIEILIVVVILGILAAIVIPQFTSASEDAQASSVQSQLQTVRGQVELFRVQNGSYPDFNANGWDQLVNGNYLMAEPRNAMRSNATGIVVGAIEPGNAAGGAATDGWMWHTGRRVMYAIDADGNVLDF
ncbi:MAG: prepilin-type N-terminal cleavage/methylation domain-containing protein [Phycisphaeraceae bacterium]|nr:prepilin-type N-terminal cleavage/methylation domain-containing protein [Phycisphaeraceae bacterium]